jgi:hypothetical protein
MDTTLFTHPFAIGFYCASVFTLLALYHLLQKKSELSRYRRHISDRMELDSDTLNKLKVEAETLRKENESLRVKVNTLNDVPERKLQRDLEIYARAEKRMLINVPGFAPAWETAKSDAHHELTDEEAGKTAPKRLFSRLFGGGAPSGAAALPEHGKTAHDGENGAAATEK